MINDTQEVFLGFLLLSINWFALGHQANLESLPPHVPTYLRAAVGPPSSTSRRHFCTVCGFSSNYTCVQCGTRFCSTRCRTIHNDTRCLKFVAWLENQMSINSAIQWLLEMLFQVIEKVSWEFGVRWRDRILVYIHYPICMIFLQCTWVVEGDTCQGDRLAHACDIFWIIGIGFVV